MKEQDNNNNDEFHDEWVPLAPETERSPSSAPRHAFCPPCTKYSSIGHLWSSLTFGWFTPVLQHMQEELDLGQSPNLEDDDNIPSLPKEDSCQNVFYGDFERLWKQEQHDNPEGPSLVKVLWHCFSPMFLSAGILKLIHDVLQFVGPQVLNGLIRFIREPTESIYTGLALTAAVTLAQLLMSLCLRHYFYRCYRVGLRIRTAVLTAIYNKSLTIDSAFYDENHSVGKITNLMSVDVQRLQGVITFLHAIWYSFLQIVLAIYFLWKQLGPSCLAGVLVILLSIPFTAITAQWMGKLQKKLMEKRDDRQQCSQETVTNMKIVKLQAWEKPFREKINLLRKIEMKRLFIYDIAQCMTWLLWSAVPLLIAVSTFAAYVAIAKQSLDVASALTALALFEILRFPLFMLPYVINMIVEASVSVKRIQEFLNAPDYTPPRKLTDGEEGANAKDSKKGTPVVALNEATFTYHNIDKANRRKKKPTLQNQLDDTEQDLLLVKAKLADAEEYLAELEGRSAYTSYASMDNSTRGDDDEASTDNDTETRPEKFLSLRRVDFECYEGEFVAVVGGVGSGKTSLLKAILGECQRVSGDVGVRGDVAYFDQKPFIMNDTVRGNILFGKSLEAVDENLYRTAIKSACLTHDLEMLSHADETEIGEKGITLSGGQKARVAMGRCVYRDADIMLLDDCLSAVDAHVGKDLFDKCIIDVLLKTKRKGSDKKRTVVLVTNALQYLNTPQVDRIVVMKNGRIVESGSYKQLAGNESSHFRRYMNIFNQSMTTENKKDSIEAETEADPGADSIHGKNAKSERKSKRASDESEDGKKADKLMTDEMDEREIGKVDKEVYLTWAKAAGGLWVVIPLFLVFAAGESMKIFSNWWLTYWSHEATPDTDSQLHFLIIYALINVGAICVDFCRMFAVLFLGLLASSSLFSALLDSTLMAPMSFFDTTPAGRITNRFSKDINTIDEELPSSFQMYVDCMFQVMSTIVVVTSVTPWFAAVLFPLLLFYRRQQAYFSQCYRELKRIDSVTRSPIYALFGETLDGYCTIRAFGAQNTLFHRIMVFIDRQQHAYFLTQAGLCWLAVRLELIGTAIVFCACMAAVLEKQAMPEGDEVFAGLAGLSISYALSVTQSLNWAVRTGSDFEANMVSVERVRQYTHLDKEAPHDMDTDDQLEKDWPSQGRIEFKDSKLRYRPGLPLVLKGLNLTIPSQAKVGVVGRTGAGKSTLMTALMRLVELDGGQIILDGVDTKTVGLTKLRSNIAVIPQDPVLFSGTVKTNLDPFDQHSKERLMDVLGRVGLYSPDSTSTIKSLGDSVMQDGTNYSAGQRQLLVIARALLDGAAVVICDEATASIDAEADSRIQKLLRQDFKSATTLTVAHRLNTIMDSTHILVMSDGRAVEFDTPQNLLSKGGMFSDLVKAASQSN